MKRNLPFFNFGLRWNKSVYVLASSDGVDKYSLCAPCTDLSSRLYRHYSNFPDPDLHSCGIGDPSIVPLRKWHFIPSRFTFICQAAIFVLKLWQSEWHAAPSAPAAPTRNKQGCSLGTRLPGRPRLFRKHPPPLPPPTSLFAKVRAQSAELFPSNCLAGSGCRCYCFCVWFCLPVLSSFPSPGSCERWLPGRLVCAFLRSWKNVACEREVEALASATCELLFF